MLPKPIDSLAADDLTTLVANRVPEGRSLECKETLPGTTSHERREFLADISSLANTVGGWILYGITEERDEAGKTTGIPHKCSGLTGNPEAELLRLDSMARDGIEPRIQGLRSRAISSSDSAFVLVYWVPKSLRAPHMVVFEGASRFWARGGREKYRLDVQELREAFVASETVRERIRAFRLDRITQVGADETPVTLRSGPRAILHVIPVGAFDTGEPPPGLELAKVVRSDNDLFGFRRRVSHYNFDGLVACRDGRAIAYDYVQLFRHGTVEFVRPLSPVNQPDSKFIPSQAIEQELVQELESYLRSFVACSVGSPLLVALSCVGIKGWVMALPTALELSGGIRPFDRDTLVLPEVWLDETPAPLDFRAAARILRVPLDALWQSAGWETSPYFNPDGTWGRSYSAY